MKNRSRWRGGWRRKKGFCAGISCGAAVAVAVRLGKLPEFAGKTIVVVLPDAARAVLEHDAI